MPVYLYRHFDGNDVLLYVGVAKDPAGRYAQHLKTSPWAVLSVRMTTETFSDRAAAQFAEARAIFEEKPLHNVAHLERPRTPATPLPMHSDKKRRDEPTMMISARLPVALVDAMNKACTKTKHTRSQLIEASVKKFLRAP